MLYSILIHKTHIQTMAMRNKQNVLRQLDNALQVTDTTRRNLKRGVTNEQQVIEALEVVKGLQEKAREMIESERDVFE